MATPIPGKTLPLKVRKDSGYVEVFTEALVKRQAHELSNHISNLTCKLQDKLKHKQAILTAQRVSHANTKDSRPSPDTHPDPDRHMITSSNVSIRQKRRRRKCRKTTRKLDTTTVINLSSVQLT